MVRFQCNLENITNTLFSDIEPGRVTGQSLDPVSSLAEYLENELNNYCY